VVIDDLKMTGTLEKIVIKNLADQKIVPDTLHFGYFAESIADLIPARFEDELNFAAFKNYKDYLTIIKSSQVNVVRNMRNMKYIL
jgi:PRTase ComF-like